MKTLKTKNRSSVDMLSNVAEIPIVEARRLLGMVNQKGIMSRAYLRGVNHYSNSTGEPFLKCFKKFMDNPAMLLAAEKYLASEK